MPRPTTNVYRAYLGGCAMLIGCGIVMIVRAGILGDTPFWTAAGGSWIISGVVCLGYAVRYPEKIRLRRQ